jgi:hypothetical protein
MVATQPFTDLIRCRVGFPYNRRAYWHLCRQLFEAAVPPPAQRNAATTRYGCLCHEPIVSELISSGPLCLALNLESATDACFPLVPAAIGNFHS